jgi:hypothetical protein
LLDSNARPNANFIYIAFSPAGPPHFNKKAAFGCIRIGSRSSSAAINGATTPSAGYINTSISTVQSNMMPFI